LSKKSSYISTKEEVLSLLIDAQETARSWLRRYIRKKSLGYTLEQVQGVMIDHIYNNRIVFTFIDPYNKKKTLTIPRSFLDEFQEETKVLVEGILRGKSSSFIDPEIYRIIRSRLPNLSVQDIIGVSVLS
jgi:hypothetical protein